MARRRVEKEIGWRDAVFRVPDVPFLDWKDVEELTGYSETTVRRMIADGRFPPQLVGGGWSDVQIGAWVLWMSHGPRQNELPGEAEDEKKRPAR